jgi:hypothetical protein
MQDELMRAVCVRREDVLPDEVILTGTHLSQGGLIFVRKGSFKPP